MYEWYPIGCLSRMCISGTDPASHSWCKALMMVRAFTQYVRVIGLISTTDLYYSHVSCNPTYAIFFTPTLDFSRSNIREKGIFVCLYIISFSCNHAHPTSGCVIKTQDSRLKTQKYLFDHYLHFLKLDKIKQLHKFLIYKVKETSIKTTCGRWHGRHLRL